MKSCITYFVNGVEIQNISKYNKIHHLDSDLNFMILTDRGKIGLFKRHEQLNTWNMVKEGALTGELKFHGGKIYQNCSTYFHLTSLDI